jgi:hypothetical protein
MSVQICDIVVTYYSFPYMELVWQYAGVFREHVA